MQSMPLDWQARMVECLEELEAAFRHVERPDTFIVEPAEDRYVNELSDGELRAVGYTVEYGEDETVYYDLRHNEVDGHDHVLLPIVDTIPHYNRGRTYIQPREHDHADGYIGDGRPHQDDARNGDDS
jgi:hypothetical protein